MQIALTELLRLRPIVHPTRIVSTSIFQNSLRITVRGYPWWLIDPGELEEDNIDFLFTDVIQGVIRTGDFYCDENFDESLDDFNVTRTQDVSWARPESFSIFCSMPLSDPISLYIAVDDFLKNADSYRGPEYFLNYPSGRVSEFIKIASSNSFLVARGPECIREVICGQLKQQGVAYNVIETSPAPAGHLLVTLQGSHFFCAAALAEFKATAV